MHSHLLLTGATGTIGKRLLPILMAADPSREITILVRTPGQVQFDRRLSEVQADLSSPELGLDRETRARLARTLTDIVHCGADIRFNRSLAESRSVNTEGTSRLLSLARNSPRFRRFAHVSTTYVMGRDAGVLPESEYSNETGFVNTYQQAKHEAERLVLESRREFPVAIFRLSSVIGEETNYFHQAVRFIPRNPFPMIPAQPGCRMDLIPAEWAVAALSTLFERHFTAGAIFNICAGRAGSIDAETLIALAFAQSGNSRLPAMVSLNVFEEFSSQLFRNGAREPVKGVLQSISSFLPHLAIDQIFENAATEALLRRERIVRPDSLTLLRQVLQHVAGNLQAGTGTFSRPERIPV